RVAVCRQAIPGSATLSAGPPDGPIRVTAQRVAVVEGAAHVAAQRAAQGALAIATDGSHPATQSAAGRSAQSAAEPATEHLRLKQRRAADQRKRHDRLDDVLHVMTPDICAAAHPQLSGGTTRGRRN